MSAVRAGEAAARAGVPPETLRYYERRGLLPAPERTPGGHRTYAERDVVRLRAVRAAQGLGFTLREIADLIAPRRRPHLAGRAGAKLREVEARIAALQATAATLRSVVARDCPDLEACATTADCPIPV